MQLDAAIESRHIWSMARPIVATPPLTGDEAEELAASLGGVASPEEIARRQRSAQDFFAAVTRPKALTPREHGDAALLELSRLTQELGGYDAEPK